MTKNVYTSKQMEDAGELAKVLISVSDDKRPLFALMLEAMMIGAELAVGPEPDEKKAG